ncbi:unnamed protein product, partial [Mesorhabditis belari]|uniref:UAS domain-containing protein n=1 Tax=Mesorhabditis belari TaxID=2138241 RepID=A0AAF3E9Q6_9BILA
MGDLSEELVRQFQDVCAVDDAKAIQFLRHCDGNLEEAVQLFFGSGGTLSASFHDDENNANDEVELRQRNVRSRSIQNERTVRRAHFGRPAPVGWMQWFRTLFTMPMQFIWHSFWDLLAFFMAFFESYTRPAVTDPIGDINAFLEQQSRILAGSQVQLPFSHVAFAETARQAKQQLKPLLVYLHSQREASTRFLRDSLASPEVSRFINESEFVLWGAGNDRPEGKNVAFNLRVHSYPFLGLLYFESGRMHLVLRLDKLVSAQELYQILTAKYQEIRPQIMVQRYEKAQREEDTRLREQQNREYEESQRKDREKAELRREEENLRQQAEVAKRDAEEKTRLRNEHLRAYRADLVEKGENTQGNIRVQVRYPSGDRTILQLLKETSLDEVFDAIYRQKACPTYFSVATVMPRTVLNLAPKWYVDLCAENERDGGSPLNAEPGDGLTVESIGLENGTTIMVQDLNA